MHLIHLADYGGPYAGSFVPMLLAVGREATARGWQFEVVFSPISEGKPWLPLLKDYPVNFISKPDAYRYLKGSIDGKTVLHSHFSGFDATAAALARDLTGVRTYWHAHSALPRTFSAQFRNRYRFAWQGRGVSAILCVTPDIKSGVQRRFGRSAHYLPNAIDTRMFSLITPQERNEARRSLGIPPESLVLLHFGGDWYRKGGDLMLDALPYLPKLHVITVASDHRDKVSWHAETARVTVLQSSNDVRTFYSASDVFLSSSRAEGMPYSVLESLSCGLPVALTPIIGHRMIAEGAPNCFLSESLSPKAIAEAVNAALAASVNPETAHEWISNKFGVEKWASDLCDRYAVDAQSSS